MLEQFCFVCLLVTDQTSHPYGILGHILRVFLSTNQTVHSWCMIGLPLLCLLGMDELSIQNAHRTTYPVLFYRARLRLYTRAAQLDLLHFLSLLGKAQTVHPTCMLGRHLPLVCLLVMDQTIQPTCMRGRHLPLICLLGTNRSAHPLHTFPCKKSTLK